MMRNRITLILLLIGIAIVLVFALRYPGEVVIKLANYPNLSINLYLFIAMSVVLLLVLGGLFKIIAILGQLPSQLGKTHRRHQLKKDEQTFSEGLDLYLQGNYAKAAQLLIKAEQSHPTHRVIAGLLAADAALLDNDIKTAHKALALTGVSPGENATADIIAADIAINDEAPESAAFRISSIIDKKSSNLRAIRMLIKLCEKTAAWHLAEQVLRQLDRALHDAPHRRQQIRGQIISALLKQATEQNNKQRFNQLWDETDETTKAQLLDLYIPLLIQQGELKAAEHYLEKMIARDYSDSAIEQYGLLSGGDTKHRIKQAEKWLAQRPDNPVLLMCLARLYKANAQFSQAREYFEKSLAVKSGDIAS